MTFTRLIACAAALAFAFAAAPAAAQEGGGASATGAQAVADAAAQPAPAPDAIPAQDDTPTTPGGQEQPPAEQPDGEQTPTDEGGGNAPSAETGTGGGTSGGLPQTGWQAFALASIGLGLLLAGAALRPTSSWPPPRDRLSRSMPRR
jgi:hypothetical protein